MQLLYQLQLSNCLIDDKMLVQLLQLPPQRSSFTPSIPTQLKTLLPCSHTYNTHTAYYTSCFIRFSLTSRTKRKIDWQVASKGMCSKAQKQGGMEGGLQLADLNKNPCKKHISSTAMICYFCQLSIILQHTNHSKHNVKHRTT